MNRYAIFVDAGYLTAQAIKILAGKRATRAELRVPDPVALVSELRKVAEEALGNRNCLRTYWYDGIGSSSMTPEQVIIASLPDVQFRGGTIHNSRQKGVDSRIVHDLFELASNRAISDAMVVTGDGDLAVGIEFAQRRGLRVALLSIEDLANGVAANRHTELLYLADRQVSLDREAIERLFRFEPKPAQPPSGDIVARPLSTVGSRSVGGDGVAAGVESGVQPRLVPENDPVISGLLTDVIAAVIDSVGLEALKATNSASGGVESSIDRVLLSNAQSRLGRRLTASERNAMRKEFLHTVG